MLAMWAALHPLCLKSKHQAHPAATVCVHTGQKNAELLHDLLQPSHEPLRHSSSDLALQAVTCISSHGAHRRLTQSDHSSATT